MGDRSGIEWTDATWNPIIGCNKISPGCKNCYAERLMERFRGTEGSPFEFGFDLRLRPEVLDVPARWRRPRKVFVCSVSDILHVDVPMDFVLQVLEVCRKETRHTFQILTKRSSRLMELDERLKGDWPVNVWMGVSVEDRKYGLPRIPDLQAVKAKTKFLSVEPLLEDLGELPLSGIDQVIVGGESGPMARPMDAEWVRSIRDQCVAQGVSFFFKQWGGIKKKITGRLLDGRTWDEMPAKHLEYPLLHVGETTPSP